MAKRSLTYPRVVGIRLTDEDLKKLDRLADLTYRGRADVLRYLIHQADTARHPDLIISDGGAGVEAPRQS